MSVRCLASRAMGRAAPAKEARPGVPESRAERSRARMVRAGGMA